MPTKDWQFKKRPFLWVTKINCKDLSKIYI